MLLGISCPPPSWHPAEHEPPCATMRTVHAACRPDILKQHIANHKDAEQADAPPDDTQAAAATTSPSQPLWDPAAWVKAAKHPPPRSKRGREAAAKLLAE
jgi:hypothetical protein